MNIKRISLALAVAAGMTAQVAQAADAIDLSRYSVSGTYALDIFNGTSGGLSGLEGSAIAYARDRGTLFFVGDEGTGIIEVSLTGQTVSSMTFNWAGTGSTKNDTEGLTYLGNGTFVVTEERLQNAYKFNYVAGGTVALGSAAYVSLGPTIGNIGIEGISYDPRNGGFVAVKQDDPAKLSLYNTLSFSTTAAADAVANIEYTGAASNSSLFGLQSLSDVQTLATVDALQGTAAADNLLLLSLDSRKLVELTRGGVIKSSFDLSNVLPHNAIEGVTVGADGTIYLVAEQVQDGSNLLPNPQSQLIVLTAAPVPEPEGYALGLTALIALGVASRRKQG
jgi:uncharacterized protein YjiK